MDLDAMKEWIASGNDEAMESAWMAAAEAEQPVAPADAAAVLAALVEADRADQAEALGWAMLEERKVRDKPGEALKLAQALAQAVPASAELRDGVLELYRLLYGAHEHFEALLRASDLMGGSPPRRAFATLDLCLRIGPGAYLANRFHNQVLQVKRYDAALGEYELEDLSGGTLNVEPRKLADEFALIGETDFRVLSRRDPRRVREAFQADPAAVLIGICQAHDGSIDAARLKDELVPRYLSADEWGGWWNRARTAAKRSDKLTLEGRNPITVVYHPEGRSLEDELAGAAASARTPLDLLAVLRTYAREARQRKTEPRADFAGRLTAALADQARSFAAARPADALAAALALAEAATMRLPPAALPAEPPSPEAMLAAASDPVRLAAALGDESLWSAAVDALTRRPDAPRHLASLLDATPARRLDKIAALLRQAGRAEVVSAAAAAAMADPLGHLEICLWLWSDSPEVPRAAAGRLEVLTRLLKLLQDLEIDPTLGVDNRREIQRQVRTVLAGRNCAGFREVVASVDEAMASILKTRIERGAGLASTARDEMLRILRESFFQLFAKAKIDPWLDESVIWTTPAGLSRYEADYRHLVDVLIPANSRAIGAAAEHGDLSENSEWKFAVEQRREFQARQAKIQDELARARVLHRDDVPADHVGIGSRVTLRRTEGTGEVTLTILGPWDTDVRRHVYSYQTGLAGGILGLRVGQKATLRIDDAEAEYEITAIEPAEGL